MTDQDGPVILDESPAGATVMDYLADALTDPTSALLVSAERALAAEFPLEFQARLVLGAIGVGERHLFAGCSRGRWCLTGLAGPGATAALQTAIAELRIEAGWAALAESGRRISRYQTPATT